MPPAKRTSWETWGLEMGNCLHLCLCASAAPAYAAPVCHTGDVRQHRLDRQYLPYHPPHGLFGGGLGGGLSPGSPGGGGGAEK